MRILLAGDAHGNTTFLVDACRKAADQGIDRIFQLGDFGYWEHTHEGKRFLDKLDRKARESGVMVYWLDGNHDNHPLLRASYTPGDDGFVEIRPNIIYSPRGHVFEWAGTRIMTLGGAYSIDKGWRLQEEQRRDKPGSLWWPTELITDEERDYAISQGPVDVLLSHDAPWGIQIPTIKNDFWQSNENRRQLAEVVKAVKPRKIYTGHYHLVHHDTLSFPYDDDGEMAWWNSTVQILTLEGQHGSLQVLELSADDPDEGTESE